MLFQVWVYIPKENKEEVKSAVFQKGGGKIGNYDSCCFEIEGTGQYRPLDGANPHIGLINQVEHVQEVKVEFICHEDDLQKVIHSMKKAHPYEEVAYGVVQLYN
ncbi:MAG: NGG1p interacting factor NIF3 [Halobacteriovoraceae bacterium]|nr:NGG1p interacting factor NIF3 [Halobacteriovoraceae bacterium]